ncbi:hypothetical protein EX30DRAFT_343655 [Ascodesmis nigricans]|uniref:SMP domain-containing protein n=1 Tax=Ascodesmis nigricans TaxID=341454 RepID=A0A4S2MLW1_9PEZI|nr:hypothetical protein EX30DRAFT_343655 [Ascodesmis nigricans]
MSGRNNNAGNQSSSSGRQHSMSKSDASRIQSTQAKSGGDAGFASRAQSAGDRNANTSNQGNSGKK